MRKPMIALFLATGLVIFSPPPRLYACGDKLLSIARSIRLQHAYKTRHPAKILVYAGHAVNAKTTGDKDPLVQMSLLYMSLRLAGHKPLAAEDVSELDEALKISRFDFVVADLADMPLVMERIAALNASTSALPVIYKANKAELAAAVQQFKYVLKVPATSTQHLEAVDGAMKLRASVASRT